MEIHDFDVKCQEILVGLPSKISRHCFRSAINHLEKAEVLFPIDKSMAVFRCITAEEEAASGLMHCLKDKGYKNTDKLNPRDHVQKHAVIQFLSILCQFAEDQFRVFGIDMHLLMREVDGARRLAFEVAMESVEGVVTFYPDPPFNFQLLHEGKRFSYKGQIQTLIDSKQMGSIGALLKNVANLRNLLLYASPKGFPAGIEIDEKFFPAYQRRVFTLLRIYLMIEPYEEVQVYVQDVLDAFLGMLKKQELDDLHAEF